MSPDLTMILLVWTLGLWMAAWDGWPAEFELIYP